jgi:hypothetical protein
LPPKTGAFRVDPFSDRAVERRPDSQVSRHETRGVRPTPGQA